MPAISQCPIVVSFPLDSSFKRAKDASGAASFSPAVTPSILNSPNFFMFGIEKHLLFETDKSVLLPMSPYSAASGSSPIPTLSNTIKKTLFILPPPLEFGASLIHFIPTFRADIPFFITVSATETTDFFMFFLRKIRQVP